MSIIMIFSHIHSELEFPSYPLPIFSPEITGFNHGIHYVSIYLEIVLSRSIFPNKHFRKLSNLFF